VISGGQDQGRSGSPTTTKGAQSRAQTLFEAVPGAAYGALHPAEFGSFVAIVSRPEAAELSGSRHVSVHFLLPAVAGCSYASTSISVPVTRTP
jgi:hypothetical protein